MANNLRKFNTYSDYEAAELVKPAVSLIAATDDVYFDQKDAPFPPTPTFSGLTAHFNIDTVGEYPLFNGGGGSGSGSGSGSGGALPSAMIVDGTEVEVTATYQFDTVGEHIVNYSFADNQIPNDFMNGADDKFLHLVGIEIGDAITSIGGNAFSDCYSLTSINILNSVTTIGNGAFGSCRSLTGVTIPNSVTSIGGAAFLYCSSLTSVNIPSGVTNIDGAVFQGCSGLTSINIPDGVTTIGNGAFGGCTSLTSINIPNSITSIGGNVFQGCSGLTSATIGSGVTSIGIYAFEKCSSLTSITVNATTPPTLGNSAFTNTNDCPIYVPQASVNTYKSASGWSPYTSRIQAIQ